MTAGAYAAATRIVDRAISNDLCDVDETVAAYMVMRAALLYISAKRGSERAAELAYKLADEWATSK